MATPPVTESDAALLFVEPNPLVATALYCAASSPTVTPVIDSVAVVTPL